MQRRPLLRPSVRTCPLANVLYRLFGPGGPFTHMIRGPGSAPKIGTTPLTVCIARTRVLLNMVMLMSRNFWLKLPLWVLNTTWSLDANATLRRLPVS